MRSCAHWTAAIAKNHLDPRPLHGALFLLPPPEQYQNLSRTTMNENTQLLIGGSDATNGDYSRIHRLASAGQSSPSWGCPKKTRAGNRLLIYIIRPESAIIATAVALTDAEPGKGNWRYVAKIGRIRILEHPITLEEMHFMFPKWAWLRFPRAYTYLDSKVASRLWRRAEGHVTRGFTDERSGGAGFGDSVTNRLVERAAVNRVTRHLRNMGFNVVSKELEQIGYDLEATDGRRTIHAEVKGVSGSKVQFPITAGEVRRAGEDPAFRLYVVTNARARTAKIHPMMGAKVLKHFELTPISFIAKRK